MRPASEVHSALGMIEQAFERRGFATDADAEVLSNLSIARDVLAWVVGGEVDTDDINAWLAAYLLDDPPQLDSTPPEAN